MTGNRRALALRCRAKGHIVATVDIDPDGVAWLTVPRPSVAEKRGDVIGHDRRGRYGPGVTNLNQLQ
ncbi:MAG: hypothetical protein LCI03_06950, partial [Actinobacteria bacterium]|nr:hypothetical protein [Actinomycetota bacterium]